MSFRRNLKIALAAKLEERLQRARMDGLLEFHLPGQHDQESHGNWSDGLGDVGSEPGAGVKDKSGVVIDVGEINNIKAVGKVGIEDWQRNHGISRSVMASRGYQHYDRTGETADGKIDPTITAAYGTDDSAMAQMQNAARQSSGLIMTRHAIPGSPQEAEKHILPQTRPDTPIISANNLTEVRKLARAEGIIGPKEGDNALFAALEADPELRDKIINGTKLGKGHPTGPDGEKLQAYGSKYLFPAGEDNAGRVDLVPHKENVKNFVDGDGRVYLAMEGSLKTDSVLTALDASGRLAAGDSAIGVPSVTLWQNPEMSWAAEKHLSGREVVLIPDADGVTNPMVINQARALQARLESFGAKVIVATPPLGRGDSIQEVELPSGGKEKLKGVDDFLGAGRGSLEGLTYVDRVVNTPSATELALIDGAPSRMDGVESAANAYRALSFIAGPSGTVRLGSRSIGAAIGRNQKTAISSMEYLERMGLVRSERLHEMGPTRIQELVDNGVLPRVRDEKTGKWKLDTKPERITVGGDTFELRDELKSPVYTIVNPAHRAVDAAPAFIADRTGSGARIVRTPEGAAFYGQPIGSIIEADKYKEGIV